jgi:transcriptional regulator with AAA-type ATPase domain
MARPATSGSASNACSSCTPGRWLRCARKLFDSLGVERARGLLVRMGFASGMHDGELAVKRRRDGGVSTEDAFLLGPKLHTAEGIVSVKKVAMEIDLARGHYFGEFLWENCWEDEAHIADFGFGEEPACWTQIGYASGYTSAFMGRLVLFKEVECRAQGDSRCRIVGQTAEAWNDDGYAAYFRPQSIGAQLIDYNVGLEQLRTVQPRRQYDRKLVGVSPAFKASFELLKSAGRQRHHRAPAGRDWSRQGDVRALAARQRPAVQGAVHRGELRRDPARAHRGGAVRRGEGRLHRRAARPRGPFRARQRGHAVPRRSGRLPLAAQVKLLRALQSSEVERLGSEQATRVDVRIVAATNVDLQRAMQAGKFRTDLFYRLNTFPITIAPLRERSADIPALVERFLEKYSEIYKKKLRGLTDKAMREVLQHRWPGNIRELENVIERAVLLAPDNGAIEASHLFGGTAPRAAEGGVDERGQVTSVNPDALDALCEQVLGHHVDLESLERRLMQNAMQRAGGNLSQAARLLGITRPQLAYRLKKEGVPGT